MRYTLWLVPLLAVLMLAASGCGKAKEKLTSEPTPAGTAEATEPSALGATAEASPQPTLPEVVGAEPAEALRTVVADFIASSRMVRVACLDVNGDGLVDGSDADPSTLPDITGDGATDDADTEVVAATSFSLPAGKPAECADGQPAPDWQVGPPAEIDCAAGTGGVLLVSAGGGTVDLNEPSNAAGIRWMQVKLSESLDARGVANQMLSIAPGLAGTEQPQPDAETWTVDYLESQLTRHSCLHAVLFGHSHGGMLAGSVASQLEAAGLGDRVLLTVLVDRIGAFYVGGTSLPQVAPVLNIYQTNDALLKGSPVEQANVENWDVSGEQGPSQGDQGGPLAPINHVTVDNSLAVLAGMTDRILEVSCNAGLC